MTPLENILAIAKKIFMHIILDSEIPIIKVLPPDNVLSVVQKNFDTEKIIAALFVVAKD